MEIIATILESPAIWKYAFPLNIIAIGFFVLGGVVQIYALRKKWKWLIFPLMWLVVSLSCEWIYYADGSFDTFGVAIFGLMTYLSCFGSVISTLFYLIWTKTRNS